MDKYTKKSVTIEAVQITTANIHDVAEWCNGLVMENSRYILVPTLEGDMIAYIDSWVIKGIKGEFYPCRDDIFKSTYYQANNELKVAISWQERVRIELDELRSKMTNLELFMQSNQFKALDAENRQLLIKQLQFMYGYATILITRLAIN